MYLLLLPLLLILYFGIVVPNNLSDLYALNYSPLLSKIWNKLDS